MLKDITGYEGLYRISDDSKVINIKTGKTIKPWINNKGYQCIDLTKDGERKHMLLHRLMAEAFVPNPNNDPIVLHLDNDKCNTDPSNLVWGTYSENNSQAIRDGLNSVPRPDNKKDFVITDGNGNYSPLYYHGLDSIIHAIGYGNTQIGHNLVHRHDKISQGDFKGFYVERLDKIDVQRSSPDGRVEPEANAGRKIPF